MLEIYLKPLIKGEGMKTFNIMRLVVVAALGMSLSAFGFLGCGSRCATKSCAPKTECAPCAGKACTLKPQQVEIVKTCDHPGYYRQVCRLEYRPCEGQVTRYKACPIFEGCFAEDGQPLDNSAARNGGVGYSDDNGVAYVQEPTIEVKRNGKRFHKNRVSNQAVTSNVVTAQ